MLRVAGERARWWQVWGSRICGITFVAGCSAAMGCGAEARPQATTNADAPTTSAADDAQTQDASALASTASAGGDASARQVGDTASDLSEPETQVVVPASDSRDAGVTSESNALTDTLGGETITVDSDAAGSSMSSGEGSARCGLLRRIALPDVPPAPTVVGRGARDWRRPAFVQRVAGAFVVGPWVVEGEGMQHLEWLWVSDDGRQQKKYSSGLPGGGEALFAMADAQRLTWIGGSTAGYYGGFIDDGAADFEQTGLVLDAVYSIGRTSVVAGVSLDGERGLLVAGLTRVAVTTFGGDGGPVGASINLEDAGSTRCWRHLPTEHGNVFVHEDGSGAIFAREFSSSGDLVAEFAPGRGQDVCPEATLLDDGFALLAYQDDSTWHSYQVRHDRAVEELWQDNVGIPLTFAVLGDETLVVSDQDDGALVRVQGGQAEVFAFSEYRRARPIPAEAGRLFLDLENTLVDSAVPREIVEVGCAQ